MLSGDLGSIPCVVACVLLTGLLASCESQGPEGRLDTYLDRLARPLEATRRPVIAAARGLPPRSESLRLALENGSLDGLDFLRLRGCALQHTVARRNSSLGRVAPPSQRVLLELAFLRDAPACIDTLTDKGESALAQLLQENVTLKKQQLPSLIFNATLGSTEYRDFWRAEKNLGDYPRQTSSLVVTALEQISGAAERWLHGDYAADEREFELALSEIAKGDGGELLSALSIQAEYLQAGDALVAQSLVNGPLCLEGRVPAAAPILRTVVAKYFVGSVQIWSAEVNQRYHQLISPLMRLEGMLIEVMPDDYRVWREQRDAGFDTALAAPASHVRSLQQLLGPCYAEFERRQE